MTLSDQILSRMCHRSGHHSYSTCFTPYMHFLDFVGFQRGFIYSFNGILGAPRGALKVQKWTCDVYPVNIGRLDYYVVFGTKSGAIQDF